MGLVSEKRREAILRHAALVGVEYLAKHKELGESDPVEV
jgi:hypothetical protein